MRPSRIDLADDRGSTIPLILGFWLIGLLLVAGSVAASDAFTKQRDLQSICDAAAIAAANSVNTGAAHAGTLGNAAIPLDNVPTTVAEFLARDRGRTDVHVASAVSADGVTVNLNCQLRSRIAFGAIFGFGEGVNQTAFASARSPVIP
jgi:Flp pilus assembly protein TadG